jgi:hypothetical protein
LKHTTWIIAFSILLMTGGCGDGKDASQALQVPQGVMAPDSMAIVMAEIQVLEAAIRSREVRKQKLQDEARLAYIGYFDTAAVSKDRFMHSLNYWKRDFGMMESIYDEAMEILSTRMAKEKKRTESQAKDEEKQAASKKDT